MAFSTRVRPRDPVRVLFDRRFNPSNLFARAASQLTPHIHPIEGDVTPVWSNHLRPLWRQGHGAVAGMTTYASFLCLQQLAAEYWFRPIALLEHLPGEAGTTHHRLLAEPHWQPRLRNSLNCTPWPQTLAPELLTCGRRGIAPERTQFTGAAPPNDPNTTPLVSWYIAGRSEPTRA
jgi:hypothetical protein